jgi:flagellar protein FlaJ
MRFKIPFTFSSTDILKKRTKFLLNFSRKISRGFKKLQEQLKDADVDITREQYIAICLYTSMFAFGIFVIVFTSILGILRINQFYLLGIGAALLFTVFLFFSQLNYPRIFVYKEGRLLDKNLLPALQDILVQLTSGVPLFNIMINISQSDYGEVSMKFKKIVRDINSGRPQIEALEATGKRTSSIFFRRTLWQISNGMRAGSDMETVISESIEALNSEKILQIQSYGARLNPLVVFYMLIAIILPALSITFMTILASMIGIESWMATLMFVTLFIMVVFIQIMFLGLIKSRRPSLL